MPSFDYADEEARPDLPPALPSGSMPLDHQPQDETTLFTVFGHPFYLMSLKYAMFFLCGTANLWPWNCFLSASEYFTDRLKDRPALANSYSSTMMTVWTVTSTVYNYHLSQKQEGADYVYRLKLGSAIQVLVFLTMTLSVLVPRAWTVLYFLFVMANVCISAIAACLMQVGVIALVNLEGSLYANANVVGNAVAGVMPSISMITVVLSNAALGGSRAAEAVKYFLTAVVVVLVSMGSINVTEKAEKRVRSDAIVGDEDGDPGIDSMGVQRSYVPFAQLWKSLAKLESTIVITFAVTLIFPVFANIIESKTIEKKLFVPLAFLVWNLGDLGGRIICAWPFFVIRSQYKMIVYSVLRIGFVPLFFSCNIKGHGGVNDYVYMLIQFLFGVTNGQLFSSAFMQIGDSLDTEDEKKAAGGFTALIINLSLLFGSLLSFIFVYISE